MQAPADDEALATAFAAKERWAFEEAYRRYGALLYSTALRVLANPEDAQDCIHDALTRVWRSPDAYTRARGAVRSFLVVCVRNEAITRVRALSRRTRLSDRLAAEPGEYEELEIRDVIEYDRLRRAMAALPKEQREPLELAYYGQKTHTEIASQLHQPLGTVKSRIALGLRKLGAVLGATR
ncbi:MAG TPA: sigma-70 family RNA polymerase sigma factor [Candidatus Baltobacteraceae bacterium]|jgi:RNA polymerase sigma-70 factor (ECF subfamily)|nr:sigma-70 family RNA polymerase sigma factor [Candidatus Baltobacteraceae bacterium]